MLAGSWSRKARRCTPRMKPNASTWAGRSASGKGTSRALVEIVQLEGLEVADQNVAGALVLGQRVEITPGLLVGLGEIAPGALLFDDQNARPEEVDVAGAIVELGYMLFIAGHAAPPDPEDLEEVVVEALRLAALVRSVPPFLGEGSGAGAHLVPRKPHGAVPLGHGMPKPQARGGLMCRIHIVADIHGQHSLNDRPQSPRRTVHRPALARERDAIGAMPD